VTEVTTRCHQKMLVGLVLPLVAQIRLTSLQQLIVELRMPAIYKVASYCNKNIKLAFHYTSILLP